MRKAPRLNRFIALPLLIAASVSPAFAETIRCEPVYKVFCGNVHIGCAWRSTVPTQAFSISIAAEDVQVDFNNGENWTAHAPKLKGERVIDRPNARDWIRIDRKSRFSMRIYRKGKALMAIGQCK